MSARDRHDSTGGAPLILASASPRRADLLRAAGIAFEVRIANVDESAWPAERPDSYVRRVAGLKAGTVAHQHAERLVVAADTTVVVDGTILGKPADREDAARMLRALSGRTHEVLTAVSLRRTGADEVDMTDIARTTVELAPLTADEVAWYVASDEPMDKAGGYAIQGLASRFITRIEGSYSNVVGLPVALLYRMCTGAGILLS